MHFRALHCFQCMQKSKSNLNLIKRILIMNNFEYNNYINDVADCLYKLVNDLNEYHVKAGTGIVVDYKTILKDTVSDKEKNEAILKKVTQKEERARINKEWLENNPD